ncbi:MAG: DUF309 domain-containing protein [Thaumarchaeota archaeon]|nr:DUF309 domain-containing protein [Nitrososphaerota archaeon]
MARATGADVRNPKWTSYGALELDVFVPSKLDFETFVAAAEPLGTLEFIRDLNQAPRHMTEEELFAEARSQFNSERYWECHETLESAWRTMEGDEKRYVQGIILVCAAFVHLQKGEKDIALGVLGRALRQLDFKDPTYHRIDTAALRRNVGRAVSTGELEIFRV